MQLNLLRSISWIKLRTLSFFFCNPSISTKNMLPSPRRQIAPANPLNLAPSPGRFSIHQLLGLQLLHWHWSLHTQLGCGTCGFLRWDPKGHRKMGKMMWETQTSLRFSSQSSDHWDVLGAVARVTKISKLSTSGTSNVRCGGCSEMGRNGHWVMFL